MADTPTVRLKRGREKPLLRRHPWIFSGAIESVEGAPELGETIRVDNAQGEFLGWGAYSPHSQITVRIWSWEEDEQVATDFFRKRLQEAIGLRDTLIDHTVTNAYRLVHGESDGLPGFVIDRFADTLVMQVLSAGAERWRETIVDLLLELTPAEGIYERSDVDVRNLEGLPERTGVISGSVPEKALTIRENKLRYMVEITSGQKTGFYLDQRPNRLVVQGLARGCAVLDCFAYSGGFTVNALAGGAESVTAFDTSGDALALAHDNLTLNGLNPEKVEFWEADVFQALRRLRDEDKSFNLVILDPPKFAMSAAQVERAARGYKDINLLGLKLLRRGGTLVTFSCSGAISDDLFQKIVAGAALDAVVPARITQRLHQGGDHPVALNFPEGAYLKGLVVKV